MCVCVCEHDLLRHFLFLLDLGIKLILSDKSLACGKLILIGTMVGLLLRNEKAEEIFTYA